MSKFRNKISRIAGKEKSGVSKEAVLNKVNTPEAFAGSNKIFRASLSTQNRFIGGFVQLLFFSLPVAIFAIGVIYFESFRAIFLLPKWLGISIFSTIILSGFLVSFFAKLLITKVKVARINNLSLLSNKKEYLQQLRQARRKGILKLEIQFENEWNSQDQENAEIAIHKIDKEVGSVDWIGAKHLIITSKLLGTVSGFDDFAESSYAGPDPDSFSNQNFHKSFLNFYRKVLPLLEEIQSVKSIAVKIEGDVLNPDASAD